MFAVLEILSFWPLKLFNSEILDLWSFSTLKLDIWNLILTSSWDSEAWASETLDIRRVNLWVSEVLCIRSFAPLKIWSSEAACGPLKLRTFGYLDLWRFKVLGPCRIIRDPKGPTFWDTGESALTPDRGTSSDSCERNQLWFLAGSQLWFLAGESALITDRERTSSDSWQGINLDSWGTSSDSWRGKHLWFLVAESALIADRGTSSASWHETQICFKASEVKNFISRKLQRSKTSEVQSVRVQRLRG